MATTRAMKDKVYPARSLSQYSLLHPHNIKKTPNFYSISTNYSNYDFVTKYFSHAISWWDLNTTLFRFYLKIKCLFIWNSVDRKSSEPHRVMVEGPLVHRIFGKASGERDYIAHVRIGIGMTNPIWIFPSRLGDVVYCKSSKTPKISPTLLFKGELKGSCFPVANERNSRVLSNILCWNAVNIGWVFLLPILQNFLSFVQNFFGLIGIKEAHQKQKK